jgi:hypothetical protein
MDEEAVKQVVHVLADAWIEKGRPKPNVDVSLCIVCNKMTDLWSTGYPKDKKITWKCKECREKEAKKGTEELERILENMCDEH